jgi:hypothetical protein
LEAYQTIINNQKKRQLQRLALELNMQLVTA